MSIGDRILWLLITGFGSGLAPVASGTFGTLPAVAIAWVIQHFWYKDAGAHRNYAIVLLALAVVLFFIGFFTTEFVERVFQSKDPKPFVLDEIVGYFVTLGIFALVTNPNIYGHGAAFFFFRLFDVLKPTPARQLENWRGAPGIMSDDAVAGVYAALCLLGLHYLSGGFTGLS